MDIYYNKHYIRLDTNYFIIKGFSDAFEQPEATDICINEEGARHFELLGQVNPPLIDTNGCHCYRYEDSTIKETTEAEKAAELSNISVPEGKTDIEKIQDNITELQLAIVDLYESIIG